MILRVFFTSAALCAWVLNCLQPESKDKIADLTCGKGSFFNHCPVESNLFGFEIEPNSYQVATRLFPKAHIRIVRPDYVTSRFNRFLKEKKLPHIRFHDLRHSSATLLISNGYFGASQRMVRSRKHTRYGTIRTFSSGFKKEMASAVGDLLSMVG